MSKLYPKGVSNFYAIIPHPSLPRFLMLSESEGWSLPSVQWNEFKELNDVNPLQKALHQNLGINVTVLCCVYACNESDQLNAVYLLENLSPAWTPQNPQQWIGSETLAELSLAQEQQRSVLLDYISEISSGTIPSLRPAWARNGWWQQATLWIEMQLARVDLKLISPIEKVKSWELSCILRVPASCGDIYFKVASTSPLFANEAVLIEALAKLFSDRIPTQVAIDRERGFMLLKDVGQDLRNNSDPRVWETILRVYGEMQIAAVKDVDTLLAAQCLDRRLNKLATQIDRLLSDCEVNSDLDKTEIAKLYDLAASLKAMCNTLASYSVPQTLVHGDLHPGNIAQAQGKYRFFDWTDGCISHPFFDLVTLLNLEIMPLNLLAARQDLIRFYLELWTAYEPIERLWSAWQLAQTLGALHQAISYQHINTCLEPPMKNQGVMAVTFWLRQVLQSI